MAAGLLAAAFLFCSVPVQALALEPAAQIAAAQVTIRFDVNGGSGSPPAPLSGEQGERLALPGDRIAAPHGAEDHVFTGWAARISAQTPDYRPGDPIVLTADQTLYAIFEKKSAQQSLKPDQSPSQPPKRDGPFTLREGEHQKYMDGGSDGLFHPAQALTRAELAQMLYNIVVERPSMGASFGAVPPEKIRTAVQRLGGMLREKLA